LRGKVVPALLIAVVGSAVLDLVFTAPEISFAERVWRSILLLIAFGATAVVITRLVRSLRTSEQQWKTAFENNPTMYFMVDASGTVLSVNAFGAAQLGYTVAELVGQPVLTVFLDEDKAAARDHVARCLAQIGQSRSWELRKLRKDGTMLWVRETGRAVWLERGRAVVLIACEDITTRRAAQEGLLESEGRLRGQASLLDLTHDAIFARDVNDVVTYWNRGAEQSYGWSSEEAVGRVTHELLRTEFREPLSDITAKLTDTGRWEGELVHTRRDGTGIVVSSRWSLSRDAEGKAAGVLETNNDITARKRAEEGLQQAQTELARAGALTTMGEFAASIAHELRQPLAAITMNGSAAVRWLNREHPDLEEARDAAARTVREAQRAHDVILGLRSLLGNREMRRAPFGIKDAIAEVLELARGELRRNEIIVRADFAPALPPVLGDRVQLQQVVLNLIMNGIEAMSFVHDRPKELVLRTASAGAEGVAIEVEDTGAGLDPTTVARIFDRFFTTKTNGLGMGLSICRSIVEAHGGQLSTSPRSPHGASFRFTIPIDSRADRDNLAALTSPAEELTSA
jgi:PAS domain S-box-containing protein